MNRKSISSYQRVNEAIAIKKNNRALAPFALVSVFAAAAVVIGSWVPFQLRSANFAAVWQLFIQQGLAAGFSRSDVVVNFWLGFPLVLGLSGLVRPHLGNTTRRFAGVSLILILQACLSLIAEIGQGWFAPRVPSASDFVVQLGGALVATLLWQWRGRWVETQFALLFTCSEDKLKATRLDAAVTLTTFGILLWTVMPFDLMTSPAELGRKFLKTELVPFTSFAGNLWGNIYQWLASFLLSVPLGLWLSRWLARHYCGKLSVPTVLLLAIAAGVLPEVCQFPIASRVASASDAFFGVFGALAGLLIGSQFQSTHFQAAKTNYQSMLVSPGFWFLLAVVQALVICAIAWMPFDFSSEPSVLVRRFKEYQSNPFSGHRGADLLNLMTLFRQTALSVVLGILIGLGCRFLRLQFPLSIFCSTVTVLLVLAFSTFVEFGQFLVNSRSGETIGLCMRSAGSLLGLLTIMALSNQSKPAVIE